MKKSFALAVVLVAAILGALFLVGCDIFTSENGNDDNNYSADGATMTWTGNWIKVSDTKYTSNPIGDNANTIERLDINATSAGTITVQITASSSSSTLYGADYGYASKLDIGVSISEHQMRVTGTQVATYTYTIPAGAHWIQFMYEKNGNLSSGSDNVTVEIISSSFATPPAPPSATTRLKVQNESSFALNDIKWGSVVVSASLAAAESKTVDVTEGTGYLYFTKGGADGLKCRTQEAIAVSANETREQVITNNTIVVALDDTSNAQALGTMEARATRLKVQNESSFALADIKWGSTVVSASLAAAESKTVDVTEGTGYLYFTKGGANGLKCRTQDVIAVSANETNEQVITNNTIVVALNDTPNTQALGTIEARITRLTVNNQSFIELANVRWNNASFANNTTENSVKAGTSVTRTVSKGEGYIFFGRKTSPITARTKSLVSVEEYANQEFTFDDTTEIVEVNNPDNTGTLGALQSTVVFWDDAEGALQPYTEAASFVGYYTTSSDLLYNSSYNNFNPPKNGQKSIAVGGTNTAKLHLRITLSKAAKLSFWYANKRSTSAGTTFSINGTAQGNWTTDVNWSKLEFDLAPGVNDLVWEKKDGLVSSYLSSSYYYLTLDDILIYYTE